MRMVDEIAALTVGDIGLLPIDDIIAAVANGAHTQLLEVAARAGFGHRHRTDVGSGHHLRQPFPLEVFRPQAWI